MVTQNYGEAGALQWYGGTRRSTAATTGTATGDRLPPRPVVYVGTPDRDALAGCEQAAILHTGVDNEEDGAGVWVCDGPVGSWARGMAAAAPPVGLTWQHAERGKH